MSNPIYKYTDNFNQSIEFHIPDGVKDIGIRVSGGADSAVLLYILIDYCEKHIPDAKIHILTCANVVKGWYNAKWSSKVIDKLLQLTGTTLIKSHYTYFAQNQLHEEMFYYEKTMSSNNIAHFFIHGTTQNPPLDVAHLLQDRYEKRDPNKEAETIYKQGNITTYMPLRKVDKRMTAHLFRHYNLIDTLLPKTRSCEQHAINNKDIGTWMESSCKKCWWCKEKKWAFEEVDHGSK